MIFLINENRRKKFLLTLKHKQEMFKMALYEQKDVLLALFTLTHDNDKLFYLAFTGVPYGFIKENHLSKRHHHQYFYKIKSKIILKEIILDWESSSRTKKDKPETARDYLNKIFRLNLITISNYTLISAYIEKMGY